VQIEGAPVGAIDGGVLLLLGVERGDAQADAATLVRKVAALRIFPGRTPLDRTLAEVGGGCLVVSQFTLAASLGKGNRPGFDRAEEPARAEALYEHFVGELRRTGLPVETGRFGASMAVELVNEGPLTLLLRTQAGRIQP
jgi:D-tyrosyl-tRNA(Tyr) deacylase